MKLLKKINFILCVLFLLGLVLGTVFTYPYIGFLFAIFWALFSVTQGVDE